MAILNQNKVRLVNYETSRSNPDSHSVIYLTAAKINKREKKEAKSKQQRIQPSKTISSTKSI